MRKPEIVGLDVEVFRSTHIGGNLIPSDCTFVTIRHC